MVKPQFEVGKDRVGKGGVVRDLDLRAEAVTAVADGGRRRGWGAQAVTTSPLPGPSGNVEFFLWLRAAPAAGRGGPRSAPRYVAPPTWGSPVRGWDRDRPREHPGRTAASWSIAAHRAGRGPRRRRRQFCRGAARARHRGPAARERRPPTWSWTHDVEVVEPTRATPPPDCELVARASAATARSCGPPSWPASAARRCSGSTSATSASSPRPSPTTSRPPSTRSCTARYTAEERLTLDVDGYRDVEAARSWSARTWALNEASVEKAARERMLEVVVEVDGRPLSRWGCDGVVCATPTGSTAYNFSAGGPIVWPEVEALLMVPISAHALFARPMVVAPDLGARRRGAGPHRGRRRAVVRRPPHRRPAARAPGSRCAAAARRSAWSGCTQAPFTDRLVAKFDLPVAGWRGAAERAPRRRGDGGAHRA